jgi:hypothetical protein
VESACAEKLKQLQELLRELEAGPLRLASFLGLAPANGAVQRARIVLEDGTHAWAVVPDAGLASALHRGDSVWLEGSGKAVLARNEDLPGSGEEARLDRQIDDQRVRVLLRGDEALICYMSQKLAEQMAGGEVKPGRTVVVSVRQQIAFEALPQADGLSHYRYLDRSPVPDVIVERDIGDPHPIIEEVSRHVRREMLQPDLGRRYRMRRCMTRLLSGVPGSGKTLTIQAVWRRLYEVMSEATGVPIDKLPFRVMHLRMAQVLSMWLGESDKQIDRFWDEVEQLAAEVFVAPDGRTFHLPVLVIGEEAEGLARERGQDAIYDRIMTTLLQRLDVTCRKLKNQLVISLFSTNKIQTLDAAFSRRGGSRIMEFTRLNRRAFAAVLQKHLQGLPFRPNNGEDQAALCRKTVQEITGWVYGQNGSDQPIVELTYMGTGKAEPRYRRHFMVGALVDRAVQAAAEQACLAEEEGVDQSGLTAEMIMEALDEQIDAIAMQMSPHNAADYVDVEGGRIATVRRLPRPAIQPFELRRP